MSDSLRLHDCSLSVSSVHGICLTRILQWIAMSSSRGSSRLSNLTCISCVSCNGRQILYHCATWEAHRLEWPSSKSLQKIVGEDVEKRELSYSTVGGNVNWHSHCRKQSEDSLKNEKSSYCMIQQSHSRAYIWKR